MKNLQSKNREALSLLKNNYQEEDDNDDKVITSIDMDVNVNVNKVPQKQKTSANVSKNNQNQSNQLQQSSKYHVTFIEQEQQEEQILNKQKQKFDFLLNLKTLQLKNKQIHELQCKNAQLKRSIITLADAYQQAKTCFEQQLKQLNWKLKFKQQQIQNLQKQLKIRNQYNYLNQNKFSAYKVSDHQNNLLRSSRSAQKALSKISIQNKIPVKNLQKFQNNQIQAQNNYFQEQSINQNSKIYQKSYQESIPHLTFAKTQRDIHPNDINLNHNQNNHYQYFRTQRDLKSKQQEIEELTQTLNRYQQQKSYFHQKIRQFQRSQTQAKNISIETFKKDKQIQDLSKIVRKLQKKMKIKNKQIQDLLELVNERFTQKQNTFKKQTILSQRIPSK